jgi:hypothetical protein
MDGRPDGTSEAHPKCTSVHGVVGSENRNGSDGCDIYFCSGFGGSMG